MMTTCAYAVVIFGLTGGAFLAVQIFLPPNERISTPEILAPLKKIQAGAPRELPPIEEGKADKPVYVPLDMSGEQSPPVRRQEAPVQQTPTPEVEIPQLPAAAAPLAKPDIHRVY
jgi:hypothetical protein